MQASLLSGPRLSYLQPFFGARERPRELPMNGRLGELRCPQSHCAGISVADVTGATGHSGCNGYASEFRGIGGESAFEDYKHATRVVDYCPTRLLPECMALLRGRTDGRADTPVTNRSGADPFLCRFGLAATGMVSGPTVS